MTNDERGSLSLEQVVQRFADSEEVLRSLGSKIERLSTLQEDTRVSAEALEESAQAVHEYAEETRKVTSTLADTTRIAGDLLAAGREVLDGSQLQRIEHLIGGSHERLDAVLSGQQKIRSELVSELDESERLETIGASVERTAESVKELGSKMVVEFQKRIASAEASVSARSKRVTWLLVTVIVLQVIVLGIEISGRL